MIEEIPISFLCENQWLTGIIHQPNGASADRGVLIVVGGPQTRVGSHRQFLLLARVLAQQGYYVMRFDYHGMGDSEGNTDSFINTSADISHALAAFSQHCGGIKQFTLWGLCDAASAILLFCNNNKEQQVDQLVLLNPWVSTAQLKAKVMIKHYYWNKLCDRHFWRKLLRLNLDIKDSLSSLLTNIRKASLVAPANVAQDYTTANHYNYVELMLAGLDSFTGTSTIILSGNDLVAAEFESLLRNNHSWRSLCGSERIAIERITAANHTFSSLYWREQVEKLTLQHCNSHTKH